MATTVAELKGQVEELKAKDHPVLTEELETGIGEALSRPTAELADAMRNMLLVHGEGKPVHGLYCCNREDGDKDIIVHVPELYADDVLYFVASEHDWGCQRIRPVVSYMRGRMREVFGEGAASAASGGRKREAAEAAFAELVGTDNGSVRMMLEYLDAVIEKLPDPDAESTGRYECDPVKYSADMELSNAVKQYTKTFKERYALAGEMKEFPYRTQLNLSKAIVPRKPFHSNYDGEGWGGQFLTRWQAEALKGELEAVGIGEASERVEPEEVLWAQQGCGDQHGLSELDARLVKLYFGLSDVMKYGPAAVRDRDLRKPDAFG